MRKLVLIAIAAATFGAYSVPASAMTYFLSKQWLQNGQQFCQYSNGTVLNVGIGPCPMSIQG